MRKLAAVVAGVGVAVVMVYALGFVIPDPWPGHVAMFLGGLAAGWLAKERGWLYGAATATVVIVVVGVVLMQTAWQASGGRMLYAPESDFLSPALLGLVLSGTGGAAGGWLRTRKTWSARIRQH